MILYLASANRGKLREFQGAAAAQGVRVETVPGIHDLPTCDEDGTTYEDNARQKALHYSAFVKGLVFADDSGISVDALGGAPGVRSARYAGPDADDAENNQKLLAELRRAEGPGLLESGGASSQAMARRAARYVCVIALAEQGRIITTVEGHAEGVIIDPPRGAGGFGYDPYFFYPPLGRTFAELTPQEKFAVSHRGEAFRRLLDFLQHHG